MLDVLSLVFLHSAHSAFSRCHLGQEVSGIDVSRVCDGTAKWQSAAVLGGKIYAVPYHAKLCADGHHVGRWGPPPTGWGVESVESLS